jgi:hypothetical protein
MAILFVYVDFFGPWSNRTKIGLFINFRTTHKYDKASMGRNVCAEVVQKDNRNANVHRAAHGEFGYAG